MSPKGILAFFLFSDESLRKTDKRKGGENNNKTVLGGFRAGALRPYKTWQNKHRKGDEK